MKKIHANLGLLNILFLQGAGGTFLASMISRAITDPWWEDYIPEPPNKLFTQTNEYINQYNHIVMTHHPLDFHKNDKIFDVKNTKWINLIVTPEERHFTNVMTMVKLQDYKDITREYIKDMLYATKDRHYEMAHDWNHTVVDKLKHSNDVLDVKWKDIFVDGNKEAILSIINHAFNGQYTAMKVVDNISAQCIAKHETDKHLYNEIKYNTEETLDKIFKIIDEESTSS